MEKNPKRALPARGDNDSPESHSDKRSRAEDTHPSLESIPSTTPVKTAELKTLSNTLVKTAELETLSNTLVKTAELQASSSAPEKKVVIRMSSITPAKKAETQSSPITPAKKADAQSTESSSEDDTGADNDDEGSNGTDSVASVPTWIPDVANSNIYTADGGCANDLKPNRPTIRIPPSRVRSRADGLYTEEEMGRLTLEAWRTRLRAMHEYMPDRLYSAENHLTKVRILQAALSHMKTNTWELNGRALVAFHHESYAHLMTAYGIPFNTCPVNDMYRRIQDGRHLERYRCVPVSQYYSMLMEDTPGFVPNATSVKPTSVKPRTQRSRHRDDLCLTSNILFSNSATLSLSALLSSSLSEASRLDLDES